jgi:adhesin transport system outer membrane protein
MSANHSLPRLVLVVLLAGSLSLAGPLRAEDRPAADAPVPMPLDTAILYALNKNPDILIALEQEKQADAAIDEARSAYYPQADVKTRTGREYNNPSLASAYTPFGESTNSWAVQALVTQVLFDGFTTDEEVERRKSLRQSSDFQTRVAVEKTLNDTISAYVDVWHYQRAVAESRTFAADVKRIADKVKLANEAGAESKTKQKYVDSRAAAAQSDLDNSEAQLTNAASDLETITGTLPPFDAVRPDQFDPTVRKMESYFEHADTDNSDLLLNRSDHAALVHQEESAKGSYWPTLSLELNGFRNNDVGGSVGSVTGASAMVVLDYKLFDGFARDANVARLRSQATENEYRQEKLQRTVRQSIRQAYNQIVATKRDLASTTSEIISSQDLQKLYAKQLELGEGDVIDTVEGAERLHTARLRSLKLEADMVLNSYILLRQIGALRKAEFCTSC